MTPILFSLGYLFTGASLVYVASETDQGRAPTTQMVVAAALLWPLMLLISVTVAAIAVIQSNKK